MKKQSLKNATPDPHRLASPGRGYTAKTSVYQTSSVKSTDQLPLTLARRNDPVYSQLSELCLVTRQFAQDYSLNRYQAVTSLLQDIMLIQKLYNGSRLEMGEGDEFLLARAMDLNAHLIENANFGSYSSSEKINILFQLRRALEIIINRYLKL